MVEGYASGDLARHLKDLSSAKDGIAKQIREWQALPSNEVDRVFPLVERRGPTLRLLSRLMRAIVKEARAYRWMPNDAFDLSHAIIPLVYTDAVFLDKQWKARIQRLGLNEGPYADIYAEVFSATEINAFLDWLETWSPSSRRTTDAG